MRGALLFLHIVGTAFWLGGLFALGVFTARARRTDEIPIVVFAYRAGAGLYRNVVGIGAWITLLSGVVLVFVGDWGWFRPFPNHWLFQMQILGILAFAITVFYLVPQGGRLARLAEQAARDTGVAREGEAAPEFQRRVRRQAIAASAVGGLLIYIVLLGAMRF